MKNDHILILLLSSAPERVCDRFDSDCASGSRERNDALVAFHEDQKGPQLWGVHKHDSYLERGNTTRIEVFYKEGRKKGHKLRQRVGGGGFRGGRGREGYKRVASGDQRRGAFSQFVFCDRILSHRNDWSSLSSSQLKAAGRKLCGAAAGVADHFDFAKCGTSSFGFLLMPFRVFVLAPCEKTMEPRASGAIIALEIFHIQTSHTSIKPEESCLGFVDPSEGIDAEDGFSGKGVPEKKILWSMMKALLLSQLEEVALADMAEDGSACVPIVFQILQGKFVPDFTLSNPYPRKQTNTAPATNTSVENDAVQIDNDVDATALSNNPPPNNSAVHDVPADHDAAPPGEDSSVSKLGFLDNILPRIPPRLLELPAGSVVLGRRVKGAKGFTSVHGAGPQGMLSAKQWSESVLETEAVLVEYPVLRDLPAGGLQITDLLQGKEKLPVRNDLTTGDVGKKLRKLIDGIISQNKGDPNIQEILELFLKIRNYAFKFCEADQ